MRVRSRSLFYAWGRKRAKGKVVCPTPEALDGLIYEKFFYNSLLDGSEEGWMYLTVHIFGLVEAALTQFLYSFHRPACLVFHAKEKAPHEAVNKFFSVYVCIFFVVFLLSLSFI